MDASGAASTATTAVGNPVTQSTNLYLVVRLHGGNYSSGSTFNWLSVGGFGLQYVGGGAWFMLSPDTFASGGAGTCNVNLSPVISTDFSAKINRDASNMVETLSLWDLQTGVQIGQTCSYALSALASTAAIKAAGISVRNASASGQIAYIRMGTGLLPAGAPPNAIPTPADLFDWEGDGGGGTAADVSGLGQNLSGTLVYSATPGYPPVCSPGGRHTVRTALGTVQSVANGVALDGGYGITASWTFLSGPTTPSISGANTFTPTFSGLTAFGGYTFQLVCTDGTGGAGHFTTATVMHGAVVANSLGIIDQNAEGIPAATQKLLGPMIMAGPVTGTSTDAPANPWPWADFINLFTLGQQHNNLLPGGGYDPASWQANVSGSTGTIVSGSATFTVTGGHGQDPCGGTTVPIGGFNAGTYIFIDYVGTDSRAYRTAVLPYACPDSSHITLSWQNNTGFHPSVYMDNGLFGSVWPACTGGGCSGLTWGWSTPSTSFGYQTFGQAPGNYYEAWDKNNYAAYYRTGFSDLLTDAQANTDRWWNFPFWNQGQDSIFTLTTAPTNNVTWNITALRSWSLEGVFMRALEEGGGSAKWAGLRNAMQVADWDLNVNFAAVTGTQGIDVRERGLETRFLSTCAIADPDTTSTNAPGGIPWRTWCKNSVKNSLATIWKDTNLRADVGGIWGFFFFSNNTTDTSFVNSSLNESVCLTNGSPTVTGTNTTWITANPANRSIWFFATPGSQPLVNTTGDDFQYVIQRFNSGTSLTLTQNYSGPSHCTGTSGTNWGFSMEFNGAVLGWGAQCYAVGISVQSHYLAADSMAGFDAPSQAKFLSYGRIGAKWIANNCIIPSPQGGLYYFPFAPGCTPPIAFTQNTQGCYGGGPISSNSPTQPGKSVTRDLAVEVLDALAKAYADVGNNAPDRATLLTAGDLLMSQMFSKPGTGGLGGDGFYASDYDEVTGSFITAIPPAAKWAGELCGQSAGCYAWPASRMGAIARPNPLSGNATVSGNGRVTN